MTDAIAAMPPQARAIELNRQVLDLKNKAAAAKAEAASLRRDARATSVKSDAFAWRKRAKELSALAAGQLATKKKLEKRLIDAIHESEALLIKRMPPEFTAWGINKTRGYLRVLALLSRQVAKSTTNTALATEAIRTLQSHAMWSETACVTFARLTPSAKSLQ